MMELTCIFFLIICYVIKVIFQSLLNNEKWWYMIAMAPCIRLVFHTLLPANSNMAGLDPVADADDPKPLDDDGVL
jgi:hypothetical protein